MGIKPTQPSLKLGLGLSLAIISHASFAGQRFEVFLLKATIVQRAGEERGQKKTLWFMIFLDGFVIPCEIEDYFCRWMKNIGQAVPKVIILINTTN